MKYYPAFLRVEGRSCVVIGGGEVAERKVRALLDAGARVAVVSPTVTPGLEALAAGGRIAHRPRAYRPGDLRGAFLAYAATDDETLHASIAREAQEGGVLLNVVDRPQWCTFIVPAIATRGDLTIAVSTGGGSPALARRLRQDLESGLGPEYERALVVLARLRQHLRGHDRSPQERRRILTGLIESEFLDCLRVPDSEAVDRLLARHAGAGITLQTLGVSFDSPSSPRTLEPSSRP